MELRINRIQINHARPVLLYLCLMISLDIYHVVGYSSNAYLISENTMQLSHMTKFNVANKLFIQLSILCHFVISTIYLSGRISKVSLYF